MVSISVFGELSISGVNEFKYTNADRIMEYRNYFSDKLQLQIAYDSFRLGLKYDFYRPKFNKFALINESMSDAVIEAMLDSEKNENYFDEYYLQYESEHWLMQTGKLEAVIGSGMVLHNYYNEDFETDSRLIGGYLNPVYDKWQMQILGGWMESDKTGLDDEYDQLGAIDAKVDALEGLSVGASYVLYKELLTDEDNDFNNLNIYSGNLNYSSALFDLKTEFARSKDENDLKGTAVYTNLTSYLGKFTLIGAYKNYENFDTRISDLPCVNHSGQQLEHNWDSGKDEEGWMGEVKFLPNYENEYVVNYAEGWNDNYKVRLSNLYTEYKHDFETWSVKAEFETLEQVNTENTNHWYKELTPALTFDFIAADTPILIKAEYQYKEEENLMEEQSHFEPRLQADVAIGDYSLSVAAERQIGDPISTEEGEDGDMWIGGELAITIIQNTDIRLFYGKEKGGVVCRNGVCKNQAEFNGLRLTITTKF